MAYTIFKTRFHFGRVVSDVGFHVNAETDKS